MSNSDLGLEHANLGEGNVAGQQVVVVLEGNVTRVPLVVGRPVGLFETCELLTHGHLRLHHASEVPACEQPILRNQVIEAVRLVVVEMLEVCSVGVAQQEGQECVSVVDRIQVSAFHKLLQVVLDHGALVNGRCLGASRLHADAVAECEHVLEALVLKSVRVHINKTLGGGDARVEELLVGLARRVDNSREEVLLDHLVGIHVAEGRDLLAVGIGADLDHFPAEEDLDASLSALFEGDLVGIAELEDFLVGSPVLDTSVLGSTSLEDILAEEVFVVKGIEVCAFTLVWELR